MSTNWIRVGQIGVDAGLCMVGDPCYHLQEESSVRQKFGKDWKDFCKLLGDEFPTAKQIGRNLAVVVDTGFGDGVYDVFVQRKGGRTAAVKVVFIEDDEEENE